MLVLMFVLVLALTYLVFGLCLQRLLLHEPAMMCAVLRGQRAVANVLASFRAPVGIPNDYLHTPYHMACARGDVELAQLLRVSGARRIPAAETAFRGDKAEVLRVSVAASSWGRGIENPHTSGALDWWCHPQPCNATTTVY